MSTNSTISILKKDGTISSSYCHYDGYLSGNGITLLLHYRHPELVKELLELGNLSTLGEKINPTSDTHNYNNRERDVCVAYHRDRKEELESINYQNLAEFGREHDFSGFDYIYNEKKKTWYLSKPSETARNGVKLVTLVSALTTATLGPKSQKYLQNFIEEEKIKKQYSSLVKKTNPSANTGTRKPKV